MREIKSTLAKVKEATSIPIHPYISTVCALEEEDIPILVQGADSIRHMIESILNGADIVSTNYPHNLTMQGRAITLQLVDNKWIMDSSDSSSDSSSKRKRSVEEDTNEGVPRKRGGADSSSLSLSAAAAAVVSTVHETTTGDGGIEGGVDGKKERAEVLSSDKENKEQGSMGWKKQKTTDMKQKQQAPFQVMMTDAEKEAERQRKEIIKSESISLWDAKYREDVQPLVPGCECHACKHYTRAYIHHLLKCKELLSEVLLYSHNQYQVHKLFGVVRKSIRQGQQPPFPPLAQ